MKDYFCKVTWLSPWNVYMNQLVLIGWLLEQIFCISCQYSRAGSPILESAIWDSWEVSSCSALICYQYRWWLICSNVARQPYRFHMEPVDRRAAVLRMKWELWTGLILTSLKTGWMAFPLAVTPPPSIPLTTVSADIFRTFFPVGRSPLALPRALSADSCLPLPTSAQPSSGVPPAASRWRLPGELAQNSLN